MGWPEATKDIILIIVTGAVLISLIKGIFWD